MSRLPILDFRVMDRVLVSLGFVRTRQKGSHIFYRHPDGRTTTVPRHKSRDLARPLIRAILREIELTPEQFHEAIEAL